MSHVQCKKCGANVLEAKAFCPECGGAMVDEQVRQHTSEHQSYDATVNLSKSGYNLMLSEMNLNISDAPNLTAERINLSKEFRSSLVLDPVKEKTQSGGTNWRIVGIAVGAGLLLLLLGLAAAFFLLR
jgi:ribosomal protein L37E